MKEETLMPLGRAKVYAWYLGEAHNVYTLERVSGFVLTKLCTFSIISKF